MRKPKKKNLFETNKYLYVEANKDLEYLFVDAEKVELNWKHEKKNYWKVKLTDQSFGSAFDAIAEIANNYEYHFVDVDGSLEGNNAKKIDIYPVSFYLPMYDWGMSDTCLADWLTGYLMENKGSLHLDTIAWLLEGLNAISKPLYKYVFSLLGDRKTRREGLIDSYLLLDQEDNLTELARLLLDQEDNLTGLARWAHVRIHSKERHPESRSPDFDPDAFIRDRLEDAKTPYDPDDAAW